MFNIDSDLTKFDQNLIEHKLFSNMSLTLLNTTNSNEISNIFDEHDFIDVEFEINDNASIKKRIIKIEKRRLYSN